LGSFGNSILVSNRYISEYRKLTRSNVPAMNDFEFEVHLLESTEGESLKSDFDKMSVEELWLIRDEIIRALRRRMAQEKRELERRLTLLRGGLPAKSEGSSQVSKPRKNRAKLGVGGVSDPNGSSRT
jgi:hypothetical protein